MLTTYNTGLLQAKAYRVLKSYMSGHLLKYGLSMPQWAFLGVVFDAKKMRLVELAQFLDVEAPFATNLADQLQKKGYVKRIADKEDRRAKYIVLTSKGEALVPEIEEDTKNAMRLIYKHISPVELATYIKVLDAISMAYSQ
jgi:MarR family 2-MHQ and catechol resistance regulon transcriptional repressor